MPLPRGSPDFTCAIYLPVPHHTVPREGNRMNLKKFALATWTLLGVALLINACGGSSVAAGPTVAPSIFIMAKNDKHAFSVANAATLHPRRSMLAFIIGDAYAATAPS